MEAEGNDPGIEPHGASVSSPATKALCIAALLSGVATALASAVLPPAGWAPLPEFFARALVALPALIMLPGLPWLLAFMSGPSASKPRVLDPLDALLTSLGLSMAGQAGTLAALKLVAVAPKPVTFMSILLLEGAVPLAASLWAGRPMPAVRAPSARAAASSLVSLAGIALVI